jgi:galactose mutarotase-like enzyme
LQNEGLGEWIVPDQNQWVTLSSGELTAAVDPLGAQLSILQDRAGRDLLWNGDASVWAGRAPLLFPIVGALVGGAYSLDSKLFFLSRHGFARGKLFELESSTAASASFRLRPDDESFQVYPFRFELNVHFALDGPTLNIIARVHNKGDADMPASFGFHPAFRWPLPFGPERSDHFIEFADNETAPIRRLNAEGLLTPTAHPTPIHRRRLALADSLFSDDVIIFDDIRSRSVTYGADTGPRIQVGFPDAPYLGVWTKPNAHFICIEPWHGLADPEGFSGDFRTKPGVFSVAAGTATVIKMSITLLLT